MLSTAPINPASLRCGRIAELLFLDPGLSGKFGGEPAHGGCLGHLRSIAAIERRRKIPSDENWLNSMVGPAFAARTHCFRAGSRVGRKCDYICLCTARPVEVISWPAPSTVWHAESRGAAASNISSITENMRMERSFLPLLLVTGGLHWPSRSW
jgi:hypothetical protein